MSEKDELKIKYDDLVWKQEQLRKELNEIKNKFGYWQEAYIIVENDLKIFKNLLKNF